eukprot:TRINITY_DN93805_c0_g1_i1.p1 TRINITY_DN93805_c0_g1~~TRINITY_DN93805_c0_g1_i1.p1  ORF type:complete len:237 (-),score=37.60 TRINITY_DN93805_c0_g1_i1:24-734(-)
MAAASCPICTDALDAESAELAVCRACCQAMHNDCLDRALLVDSRCPLCREDLSEVGYTVSGVDAPHPETRRFSGDDEQLGLIMTFVTECSILTRSMRGIVKSLREYDPAATPVCTAEQFAANAAALSARVEALRQKSCSLPRDLPGDLRDTLSNLVNDISLVMVDLGILCSKIEKKAREQRPVEEARPKSKVLRRPSAKAKTAGVCRRPATAKSKAVRKRPAASSTKGRRGAARPK